MVAGVPAAERKELGLTSWDSFFYLNQGGIGSVPGMDDAAEFADTQKALSTVGISVSSQWDIFKVCAALLHIGNINITAVRDEAQIDDNNPALVKATELLGVDKNEFKTWIIKKQIITRSEKIVTSLNQHQATTGRDSVAKFIYSMLFDWLVRVINVNLAPEQEVGCFIGVLDIYGYIVARKLTCIVGLSTSRRIRLSSSVLITPMRNYSKSSISTCSSWNRRSTWRKRSIGVSLILMIISLVLI
jgi:myosin-5